MAKYCPPFIYLDTTEGDRAYVMTAHIVAVVDVVTPPSLKDRKPICKLYTANGLCFLTYELSGSILDRISNRDDYDHAR